MASDTAPGAPPVTLLDANLLYPFHLRNLLVQLGVDGLIDVRWTDTIHEEWIGNLVADGRATRERLVRTRDIMKRVLPGADVRDYEECMAQLALPDTGDRHVLAAAVKAGAAVLLTFNLRHFPQAVLAPFGVVARDPDSFLCDLHEADPTAVEAAVEAARLNLSFTAPEMPAFLASLRKQRLAGFAARLERSWV